MTEDIARMHELMMHRDTANLSVGNAIRWEQSRMEMCDAIPGLVAELTALRALRDALPTCSPWISGSGGHRGYGDCPKTATYVDVDDGVYCCDEHYPKLNSDGYDQLPYADAVRAIEKQ